MGKEKNTKTQEDATDVSYFQSDAKQFQKAINRMKLPDIRKVLQEIKIRVSNLGIEDSAIKNELAQCDLALSGKINNNDILKTKQALRKVFEKMQRDLNAPEAAEVKSEDVELKLGDQAKDDLDDFQKKGEDMIDQVKQTGQITIKNGVLEAVVDGMFDEAIEIKTQTGSEAKGVLDNLQVELSELAEGDSDQNSEITEDGVRILFKKYLSECKVSGKESELAKKIKEEWDKAKKELADLKIELSSEEIDSSAAEINNLIRQFSNKTTQKAFMVEYEKLASRKNAKSKFRDFASRLKAYLKDEEEILEKEKNIKPISASLSEIVAESPVVAESNKEESGVGGKEYSTNPEDYINDAYNIFLSKVEKGKKAENSYEYSYELRKKMTEAGFSLKQRDDARNILIGRIRNYFATNITSKKDNQSDKEMARVLAMSAIKEYISMFLENQTVEQLKKEEARVLSDINSDKMIENGELGLFEDDFGEKAWVSMQKESNDYRTIFLLEIRKQIRFLENEPASPAPAAATEKTAEDILREMGFEVDMDKVKEEIKCEILSDDVRISNFEAIEKLLDELEITGKYEREEIRGNIELTLNCALDAEAEREFSRFWKHHKSKIAVSIGLGLAAGAGVALARMATGGAAAKLVEATAIAGGAMVGGISGALRAKIREWLNPLAAKIQKNNAKRFNEIREEKSKELFSAENLKLTVAQAIRRAKLKKILVDENISDDQSNIAIINENIENDPRMSGLSEKEKTALANALVVLAQVSRENSRRLGDLLEDRSVKKMSDVKRGAIIGAIIGGASTIASCIEKNPYMPSIAGGAISGIMTGHAIDIFWAKRDVEKAARKIVEEIDEIEAEALERKNKDEYLPAEKLSRLKSYLESGALERYPLAREKAKQILMDEQLRYIYVRNDKMIKELNEKTGELNKELEKRFKRSKIKQGLSYLAGVAGGALFGGLGRLAFEQIHEHFFVKHTHEPLNLRNQKLKSELAELRAKEMEELQKPRFIKDEEAQQRFQDEIKRIADEQNARDAELALEQGGAETGAAEAPGAGKVLEQQKDDLLKLATIKKGEGIEHAIRRQLEADPQTHGFKGDIADKAAVHKWSGGEAHRVAIKAGYVDAKTGEQIMVGAKGRNNAAYVLEKDAQGNERVVEYFKGKDGKFGVQEAHELAKDF